MLNETSRNGGLEEYPVRLIRSGNAVNILGKPEGSYKIIYGRHTKPQTLGKFLGNTKGLFLEAGTLLDTSDPLKTLRSLRDPGFLGDSQFVPMVRKAEELGLPIYLHDYLPGGNGIVVMAELAAIITQFVAGAQTLKDCITSQSGVFNRRNAAVGALGLWLAGPTMLEVVRGVSVETGLGEIYTAALPKVAEKVNPFGRYFIRIIRNTVWAHKKEWLMRKKGGNPDETSVVGSDHTGLEEQILRSGEERLEFLINLKPWLQRVAHDSLYKVIELKFINGNWGLESVHEIPELKDLLE